MSAGSKNYFLMMAYYNQWANQKLFTTLSNLTEAQLNQDCGAYFKSVLHTANHLLIGDIVWFERITGLEPSNYALDGLIYIDIKQLQQARVELDQRLLDVIMQSEPIKFDHLIRYIRRGEFYTEPLHEILAHIFNHQTHHRGQMHSMIHALTGKSLELDLIFFQREYSHLYR